MFCCKPQGIFSWNYLIEGEGHTAKVQFALMRREGEITIDGFPYKVCRDHTLSKRWTLDRAEYSVAIADQGLNRIFKIDTPQGIVTLRPESIFANGFNLSEGKKMIALITPEHALTRRATIRLLQQNCDFTTLAFSFWLVVMCWRHG